MENVHLFWTARLPRPPSGLHDAIALTGRVSSGNDHDVHPSPFSTTLFNPQSPCLTGSHTFTSPVPHSPSSHGLRPLFTHCFCYRQRTRSDQVCSYVSYPPQRSDHSVTFSGVSTQCQNTIVAVAASSQAECLNPTALLQVFLQGTSGSIVSPLDDWLKGLCALAPCSNDDLASIVTNVTTGCATEFQSITEDPVALTPLVQQIYPTLRKGVCLAE